MQFIWDDQKAKSNLQKHGVSFEEAATVFSDPLAITFDDPEHSHGEQRFLTFGQSFLTRHKLLIVAHTDNVDTIRIISARQMTNHELRIYRND
jgi:hypothetical protein